MSVPYLDFFKDHDFTEIHFIFRPWSVKYIHHTIGVLVIEVLLVVRRC